MTYPDDFEEGPPTVLDAPIPEAVLEATTGPRALDPSWVAGHEVGVAEGRRSVLEALEGALLSVGVAPAEVVSILERVRRRAEGI